MTTQKENIIKKQLIKKTKKLAELEKKLGFNEKIIENSEFKISRKIYACFDGFIILRTFSKDYQEPFLHVSTDQRIGVFKKTIPIRATDGKFYFLYELLKNTIGLEFRIGSKFDIGSNGGGIMIGDTFKIDGFQLMIYNYSEISEITETLEDIKFTMQASEKIDKLEYENYLLNSAIEKINLNKTPQIITEGKTDWKHFVTALRYFQKNGKFLEIKEDWFLRFGSGEDISNNICDTNFEFLNSVSNLNNILDSFIKSRDLELNSLKPVVIGIFDSDDKKAKERNDSKNKIYSFIIEPYNISTELLYKNDEIISLINNRRLYIGSEFCEKSKQLKSNRTINLGGDNNTLNKAGKNVIIDSNVFNQNGDNIALPKDIFSQKIYERKIKISKNSWSNFEHIFLKISEYIKT